MPLSHPHEAFVEVRETPRVEACGLLCLLYSTRDFFNALGAMSLRWAPPPGVQHGSWRVSPIARAQPDLEELHRSAPAQRFFCSCQLCREAFTTSWSRVAVPVNLLHISEFRCKVMRLETRWVWCPCLSSWRPETQQGPTPRLPTSPHSPATELRCDPRTSEAQDAEGQR